MLQPAEFKGQDIGILGITALSEQALALIKAGQEADTHKSHYLLNGIFLRDRSSKKLRAFHFVLRQFLWWFTDVIQISRLHSFKKLVRTNI